MKQDPREEVFRHCVYAGLHPNCRGVLMLFEFERISATVVLTELSHGIELGLRQGEWLIGLFENMTGEQVIRKLVEVAHG